MATITPTLVPTGSQDGSVMLATWATVTEADSCAAIPLPEYADRSVQAAGTFGGASVAVQGSNDGTNFAALNDPTGSAIALSAAGIKQVLEITAFAKPVIAGGTDQSLTITMLLRRPNPMRT